MMPPLPDTSQSAIHEPANPPMPITDIGPNTHQESLRSLLGGRLFEYAAHGRHEPAPEPSPLPATPATGNTPPDHQTHAIRNYLSPSETRHPIITMTIDSIDGSRPRAAEDGPHNVIWYVGPDRWRLMTVFGRWFEYLEWGKETRDVHCRYWANKLFYDTYTQYVFDAWVAQHKAQHKKPTNKSNKILSLWNKPVTFTPIVGAPPKGYMMRCVC